MNPEQVQRLLTAADRIRDVAKEEILDMGMPDNVLAPFFMRPQHSADWVIELAKISQQRNPGLINFLCGNMKPIEVDERTRQSRTVGSSNQPIEFDGKAMTVTEWAKKLGCSPNALRERFKDGWSIKDALTKPFAARKSKEPEAA